MLHGFISSFFSSLATVSCLMHTCVLTYYHIYLSSFVFHVTRIGFRMVWAISPQLVALPNCICDAMCKVVLMALANWSQLVGICMDWFLVGYTHSSMGFSLCVRTTCIHFSDSFSCLATVALCIVCSTSGVDLFSMLSA